MHDNSVLCFSADAEAKFGAANIKIYKSQFRPMYFAVTERATMMRLKLVCKLPDEKVSS